MIWEFLPYMVKDKKLILSFTLFTCILIYPVYLIVDFQFQATNNLEIGIQKTKNFSVIKPDSLILGGSNALYGISAQNLSEGSEFTWFNLAINNEGYSDDNYWKYIKSVVSYSKRHTIKNIVYSSARPLRMGSIDRRDNRTDRDTFGRKELYWLPNRSIASRIKEWIESEMEEIEFEIVTNFGDLDFTTKNCKPPKLLKFEREADNLTLSRWVRSQLFTMERIFPSARIYFLIPSEYYDEHYDIEKSKTINKVIQQAINRYNKERVKRAVLIDQKLFPSVEHVCEVRHHASSKGRIWRTKKLSNELTIND